MGAEEALNEWNPKVAVNMVKHGGSSVVGIVSGARKLLNLQTSLHSGITDDNHLPTDSSYSQPGL